MRSEEEVRSMLAKFESALQPLEELGEDPDDTALDGIRDALIWFMGDCDDYELEQYLPEDVGSDEG